MKTSLKLVAYAGALALGSSALAMHHEDAEKVRAMYDAASADFESCNMDAFGNYSAEGHSAYYPDTSQLVAETGDEARAVAAAFCENGGKHENDFEIADVVMLGDTALILGSGHYKRTEPDGTVSIDTDYNFTEVAVKTDGGWKLRHSHVGVILDMDGEGGE